MNKRGAKLFLFKNKNFFFGIALVVLLALTVYFSFAFTVTQPIQGEYISGIYAITVTLENVADNVSATFNESGNPSLIGINNTINISPKIIRWDTTNFSLDNQYYLNISIIAYNGSDDNTTLTVYIDNTAPTISNTSYNVTNSSCTINWSTNDAANTTLKWGTSATALSNINTSSSFTGEHTFTLYGLKNNTLYYYNMTSCDNVSNCDEDGPYNFTTFPGIPLISNWMNDTTNGSVNISFSGSHPVNFTIWWGTNSSPDTTNLNYSSTRQVSNSIRLTELNNNTQYYYNMSVCDAYNCSNFTNTWTTNQSGCAPVISNLFNYSDNESGTISWNTSEDANYTLEWGLAVTLGSLNITAGYRTGHNITLYGLKNSTTYYYNISVCDNDQVFNCREQGPYSFTTNGGIPIISNWVNTTTNESVTISFNTSHNANFSMGWGLNASAIGYFNYSSTRQLGHSFTLVNLTNNTQYYYNLSVCDPYRCNNVTNTWTTNQTGFAPVISNLFNYSDNESGTISWNTSEDANFTLEWGTAATLGNTNVTAGYRTGHNITLYGLQNSTTYYYNISVCDNDQVFNCREQGPYSFITLPSTPIISGWSNATTNSSVTVAFSVSHPANFSMWWGTNSSPDTTNLNYSATRQTSHSITLQELTNNTQYYYNLSICDAYQCANHSSSFTTNQTGFAPVISSLLNYSDNETITISWNTSESANYTLKWNTSVTSLGNYNITAGLRTGHNITLTGMSNGTTYYYNISVCDNDQVINCREQGPYTVTTSAGSDVDVPVLSNILNTTTNESVTVSFNVSEAANYTFTWGLNNTVHPNLTAQAAKSTGHNFTIQGLTNVTTYNYNLSVCDAYRCTNFTDRNFTTAQSSDDDDPIISNLVNVSTNQSVVIFWNTNENADANVTFGTSSTALNNFSDRTSMNTTHNFTINGLSNGTVYYYNVSNCDAATNCVMQGPYNFTTLAGTDVDAPTISNWRNDTSNETVTISFNVSENANFSLYWGVYPAAGNENHTGTRSLGHSITLTGLTNETTYYYNMSICDLLQCSVYNSSFTTNSTIDSDAPSMINLNNKTDNQSILLNWTTGEVANATIAYGRNTSTMDGVQYNTTYTTTHLYNISGLYAESIYYFNITSCDQVGNCQTEYASGISTDLHNDGNPPALSNLANSSTNDTITISWSANEMADATLEWGTVATLGNTNTSTYSTSHSFTLTGLSPLTRYYYNVTSCDNASNCQELGLFDVTTLNNTEMFSLYGYTYNTSRSPINGTNITVFVYTFGAGPPTLISEHSAISNETGFFNITEIPQNSNYYYKPVLRHYDSGYADYVGASLPQFPLDDFSEVTMPVNFYLKEGMTLNITALNSSNDAITFHYMVKDIRLGYPIEELFEPNAAVNQTTLYLPADRNFSIIIYPSGGQGFPVSYDVNNITSYSTPKHDNVVFNTSTNLIMINGSATLNGGINGGAAWDDLYIIGFLIEPGNMLFPNWPLPANIGTWQPTPVQDVFTTGTGVFSVWMPAAAMGADIMLLAIARNGTTYYGGFRNITLTLGSANITGFDFDLTQMPGINSNFELNNGSNNFNVSLAKVNFTLLNDTGGPFEGTAHIEIQVDYSGFNGTTFSWMFDLKGDEEGIFQIPLLNYHVKKLNVFSKEATLKTELAASDLVSQPVTLNTYRFDPGEIEGESEFSDLVIKIMENSEACDVPYPHPNNNCSLISSETNLSNFNPLGIIMGGGKMSFRMKKLSNNITVHYVDVDLLASGPPDAVFDANTSTTTSGGALEEAWRFGSKGPEIYDYIIIGFPYDEGSYEESMPFRMRIPRFYDNDWNTLWDIDVNTSGQIPDDYTDFLSAPYTAFVDNSTEAMLCSKTNQTATCYVNITFNMIWITIPHFSGVQPKTVGYANLTLESDRTNYQGYPVGTAIINYSLNGTALEGTHDITVNVTAVDQKFVGGFSIEYYNITLGDYVSSGTNNTVASNVLVSANETNRFRINISLADAVSVEWNFTMYFDDEPDAYSLDPLYIDSINLSVPADNEDFAFGGTGIFNFTLISETEPNNQTCTLYFNGTANATNSTMQNGTLTYLTAAGLDYGVWNWWVGCNESGNSTSRTVNVTDLTAPSINTYNFSDNYTQNGTVVSLTVNVTDNVAVSSVYINQSGETLTNTAGDIWFGNVTLNASELRIMAVDSSGNIGFADLSNATEYMIDDVSPVVSVVTISDNNFNNDTSITYNITVSGETEGTILNVTAEGHALAYDPTSVTWSGSGAVDNDGYVNITVYDQAENIGNDSSMPYTLDNTAPSIGSVYVDSVGYNSSTSLNYTTSSDTIVINWTVTEDNLTTTNITVDSSITVTNTTTSGSVLFSLFSGTHTFTINAHDEADNVNTSETYTFILSRPENVTEVLNKTNATNPTIINDINLIDETLGQTITGNKTNLNKNLTLEYWINVSNITTNVTIANFSGWDAEWNNTNYTIENNESSVYGDRIGNKTKVNVTYLVLFRHINNFLADEEFRGGATIEFNTTLQNMTVLYIDDDDGNTIYVLEECSGNSPPSSPPANAAAACYIEVNSKVRIYAPHLSGGALANDTSAPEIYIEHPSTTVHDSIVYVNLTVNETNPRTTGYCNVTFNATGGGLTDLTLNLAYFNSTTDFNQTLTTDFKHVVNGAYNMTVRCIDLKNQTNETTRLFTVDDSTEPAITAVSPSTAQSTTATSIDVTLSATTNEDSSCKYSTSNVSYSSMTTAFTGTGTTHTKSATYTEDATVTYYVRCNDTVGNSNTTNRNYGRISFTVDVGTSSSSSSPIFSKGGGSPVYSKGTTTPSTKINLKTLIYNTMPMGTSIDIEFDTSKTSLTDMSFKASTGWTNAKIEIYTLTALPSSVSPVTNDKVVLEYLQIDTLVKDEEVEDVVYNFQVDRAWLEDNKVEQNNVVMLRYNAETEEWNSITTKPTGFDDTYIYYKVESTGFSYYAIVGIPTVVEEEPEEEEEEEVEEVVEPEAPPPEELEVPEEPEEEGPPWYMLVWNFIKGNWIGLIIIVAIAVFMLISVGQVKKYKRIRNVETKEAWKLYFEHLFGGGRKKKSKKPKLEHEKIEVTIPEEKAEEEKAEEEKAEEKEEKKEEPAKEEKVEDKELKKVRESQKKDKEEKKHEEREEPKRKPRTIFGGKSEISETKLKVYEVDHPDNQHLTKLDHFISVQLRRGVAKEKIKRALLSVGWEEEVIDKVLEKH